MSGDSGRLLDHEYDGIREYDNPTPGWWHAIFFGSVLFSLFYLAYWHGNPDALGVQEAWQKRQVAEYRRIFGAVGELKPDADTIQRMRLDPKMMEVARSIFVTNCAACHGKDGAGISGSACVNLTDDYWKNVKTIGDIFGVISRGANNGAMPSWENRLSQNERVILAAYVASLRDHPVSGRAPEGEVIPPWPPPPPPAK
jgi:cytochrome c oxidase cbb3-type subunit 3